MTPKEAKKVITLLERFRTYDTRSWKSATRAQTATSGIAQDRYWQASQKADAKAMAAWDEAIAVLRREAGDEA